MLLITEYNVVYFSGWKDITSGKFDVLKLPGDHFYLMEPNNEDFIKNYIVKCLELSSLDYF
jgi:medium-chain acyl-[acyl-carrier-protein] hydrolase